MGLLNKLSSAFTGAARFVGTVIDKDKKVSDFSLFKDQSIKDSLTSAFTGKSAVLGASLVGGAVRNKGKESEGKLGNLFSQGGSISDLLKRQNLFGGSGFDLGGLFGGTKPKTPDFGGSFEIGSQASKNKFLPFFAIAAVVAVLWGVFK